MRHIPDNVTVIHCHLAGASWVYDPHRRVLLIEAALDPGQRKMAGRLAAADITGRRVLTPVRDRVARVRGFTTPVVGFFVVALAAVYQAVQQLT